MQIRPKRILWPTDFSELSLQGARYARAFQEAFSAELHVVHVIAPPVNTDLTVMLPMDVPLSVSQSELTEAGKKALANLVASQFKSDPAIVQRVVFGNPWTMICEYARTHHIDLIIVTTHGHTGLRHVLIGSTAERVVQHAPCPVLTVKQSQTQLLINEGGDPAPRPGSGA